MTGSPCPRSPAPGPRRQAGPLAILLGLLAVLPGVARSEGPETVLNLKLTYPQVVSLELGRWWAREARPAGGAAGRGAFLSIEPGLFGAKAKAGVGSLIGPEMIGFMGLRGGPTYLWMYNDLGSFEKGHYVGAEVTASFTIFTLNLGFVGEIGDYVPLFTAGIGIGW